MVVLKRSPAAAAPSERRLSGLAHALGCFSIWGLFPIYFKLLEQVAPLEVLMHRILWSVLLLLALLLGRGQGPVLLAAFRDRRRLRFYLMTGTLISANWLLYIWAVQNNRILEASLGYYINPLVNIVLGVVVLQERLNPRQWSAVAIAAAGVLIMVIGQGVFPWVALTLALSFGSYGLLRKKDGRSAMLGLCVETALLAPVAVLVLSALAASGAGAFGARDRTTDLLLLAA
ncbi:MAG: EamA family transporter RarD, partial [Candidatus Competibacter sp.]|nr:EamA family transporter RarD [Candidatus Competibacter sp.]